MSYSKYEVFLQVVQLGSMSRAAVRCNYSQSAVSQIISSLEKELQLTLLVRNANGIVLTTEGSHMLPYIQKLRDAEAELYEQSSRLLGVETGHVRIGTFSSVSCHILSPIIRDFKLQHPHISIEIREGDNYSIESWLLKNEVDVGFIDLPGISGFEVIPVCRDPLLAVVSQESPYASMDTVPLKIFETEPMVLFDEDTKKEAQGILQQAKVTPRVEYTSRDDNFIMSLIENNLCMGLMGKLVLTKSSYHVVGIPTEPQFYRDIVFTMRNRNVASAAAKKFIDFFEEHLDDYRP